MVPDRQDIKGAIPFNLMKSEKLVWVMEDVDYIETVARRERCRHRARQTHRGTGHTGMDQGRRFPRRCSPCRPRAWGEPAMRQARLATQTQGTRGCRNGTRADPSAPEGQEPS